VEIGTKQKKRRHTREKITGKKRINEEKKTPSTWDDVLKKDLIVGFPLCPEGVPQDWKRLPLGRLLLTEDCVRVRGSCKEEGSNKVNRGGFIFAL